MPLQTVFYTKVTEHDTVQRYPLGTIRIEGGKTYKYFKASGVITSGDAVTMAASGTVKVHAANLKPIGGNLTGSSSTDGGYFWVQVGGEVGPLDTSGSTAAGYPLYAVDATGLISGASASATAIGNSVVSVDNATGYGELCGLV
jgi:hypothetical protein